MSVTAGTHTGHCPAGIEPFLEKLTGAMTARHRALRIDMPEGKIARLVQSMQVYAPTPAP
ncbi:hypothetical protein JMJ77_0007584, partial [Colletotrichum scovillei]